MSLWGPLATRFEDPERPHRILSLDGGGIRGVITLGILAEIERQLARLTSAPGRFRLSRYFDYIGGTSTGAILAAGLARGMSVAQLLRFYQTKGAAMFEGRVQTVEPYGPETYIRVALGDTVVSGRVGPDDPVVKGEPLGRNADPASLYFFDPASGAGIR